jgi:hypothetical protein
VQAAFTVAKEDSALALAVVGQGAQRHLNATLTDADAASSGISGATVTFYSDGIQIGQAVTDSHGVATFTPPPNQRGGHHTYSASFGGNDYYLNSASSTGGGATPA